MMETKKSHNQLTFLEHLDELRSCLIRSILAIIVAACFFYQYIHQAMDFLIRPVGSVVFTSPAEALMAHITLTMLGAVLLASPYILYQIWNFISAGLKAQEQKLLSIFLPASLFLFILGALFAYFIILPIALKFFLSFSSSMLRPMITIGKYVSFVVTLVLSFAVVFELPVVIAILTTMGIVTPDFLRQKRRLAIVIILIVSAILTPPDCVSQLLMAIPIIVLYEISIGLAALINPSIHQKCQSCARES
ncbi:MAG: twin-arginine translocase subunit TatC [Candidatus Omnitrophota bacterium]